MISSGNVTHSHPLPGSNESGQACATQGDTHAARGFVSQLHLHV